MTVTYIISIILNIITVIVALKLCSKYTNLYEESSQDRVFLVTLVEYILHMKAHTDNEVITKLAEKMHYFNNRLAVYFETITQYVMFEFNIKLKDTLDSKDVSFQKVDKEELFKVNPTTYFNIRDDYHRVDDSRWNMIKHYLNLLNSLDFE